VLGSILLAVLCSALAFLKWKIPRLARKIMLRNVPNVPHCEVNEIAGKKYRSEWEIRDSPSSVH